MTLGRTVRLSFPTGKTGRRLPGPDSKKPSYQSVHEKQSHFFTARFRLDHP